nr:immunoglobulin heavy chain junction region [Macaca mulatta]
CAKLWYATNSLDVW